MRRCCWCLQHPRKNNSYCHLYSCLPKVESLSIKLEKRKQKLLHKRKWLEKWSGKILRWCWWLCLFSWRRDRDEKPLMFVRALVEGRQTGREEQEKRCQLKKRGEAMGKWNFKMNDDVLGRYLFSCSSQHDH